MHLLATKATPVCCRLNEAPVKGFEKDVGSKTTIRITYPEGAIQKTERYETKSLFVLSAFKALDFKWLRHMIFNQRLMEKPGGGMRRQLPSIT
ncbi:CMP-N-acetylneuraminate-beta-1,4-galactoside alpha-2,3-sialyltransferase-like isoform X1 [Micropterus dolomieu]|uniref:CMP-N-acetylneuraminate-beta-1,4-galactoside alpha-2,3-sialyltransferase-like isoform X1 n=1 Tax=Micropterus dolomieu TaxID=147949 RepID=UPI001E8EA0B9|nr:CMP-N-acetylneuraminate-beta-1,4-galactoside alpha-2,3-sialyltransferase-like isoform X1 [Micropterus dolomieu]